MRRGSKAGGASCLLMTFDVFEEVGRRVIEGTLIDAVNDSLADPVLPCVGVDDARGLQLLEMPQHSFIASPDAAADVSGCSPVGVLPQVAEYFGSQWIDPKDRNHGFCAFWDRGRGADILGHSFILSYRHLSDFHRLIQYDTLKEKCLNKSDTMEGIS